MTPALAPVALRRSLLLSVCGIPTPGYPADDQVDSVRWQIAAARRCGDWDGRPLRGAQIVAAFWYPDERERDLRGLMPGLAPLIEAMREAGLIEGAPEVYGRRGGVRKRRPGVDVWVMARGGMR